MPPFSDKTTIAAPAEGPRAERLAAVLDHYMCELENGGIPPDLDALIAEHPDLADELRSYVDSLRMLHQMTAGLRPMPTRAEAPPPGMVAKRLGDYDIVREIGRGGMGIVYEARQLSLNRQVALKVLPFAAMLDEKQITRFRNEALAAAQLHHPNIVPVHAVGQERGVHFFAMQFVPGQSLETALHELRNAVSTPFTETIETQASGTLRDTVALAAFTTRESTRSRGYCQSIARLMIQAADAIQHAHEYGVIHRDVKPSNLLLDRDGKLWVTDFGLARMQSDSGVTITGDVVGTLRYMSPEQAAGATGLIDVRADVYSLGATLYELLTLRPAHSGENRQEVLKHIEDREPTPPRQLNPAIPVDLETITLRALAKARDERYSSAADLATDLRLFLEGRPTIAQRPTLLDRAGKWALRHRVAVMVAAGVLLVLSIVSTSAALMIAQAKKVADAETIKANNSFLQQLKAERETRGAIDRMVTIADEFLNVPGAEQQTRRMYGAALDYYKKFVAAAAHAPGLQQDLGAVYFKAATMAHRLNHTHEAIDLCRRALAEFDAVLAESPTDDARGIERATCRGTLAFLLASTGDVDAALEAYADAIDEQRAIAQRPGTEPNPAALRALADTHSNLGLLLADIGRKSAARRSLTSGIELAENLVAATPTDRELRRKLAISYNSLSFVEREIDWSRSEEACRRAIALLEELDDDGVAPDEAAEFRSDVALYYNNLGAILAHRGDWSAACDSYRQAIDRQEQVQRLAPAVPAHRRELAVSWNNLGQALDALDRAAEASMAYNEAQDLVAQLASDYPDDLTYRSLFGAVLNNRAMALAAEGRTEDAYAAFEQAIAEQQIAFDRAPRVFEFRDNLSKHFYNYGRALRAAGDPERAAELALQRRALWTGDSKHLSQVAVELAQTAVLARELASEDGAKIDAELADRLENEVAATIREVAAAGGDLAGLRGEAVFQLLQNSTIWTIINAAPTTTGP